MQCPKCVTVALTGNDKQQACDGCGGMFVTEAALDEMLAAMATSIDPTERRTLADWPLGDQRSEHRCPHCSEPMWNAGMERVAVERCSTHGVWFDREELERVLSPDVTAESFTAGQDLRQGVADYAMWGPFGALVGWVYRQIRRRRHS